ncbi:hypothetical protein [Roseovarius salinarum]|uniref:hypothetical protein n=1 Tax=Roseovarius salinarum TaxID=1981892 RepID=UPI000C323E88|nr:hypothetical protein [Roseovarius salinarum]
MNSIIRTHVLTPVHGAFLLEAALDRLGAWLDTELGSLENLLDITGHAKAAGDIAALRGLHLNATSTPTDVRRLLEAARSSLARLLDRVRTIPANAEFGWWLPSDFDAWVCWSGARLEDIIKTLQNALDE